MYCWVNEDQRLRRQRVRGALLILEQGIMMVAEVPRNAETQGVSSANVRSRETPFQGSSAHNSPMDPTHKGSCVNMDADVLPQSNLASHAHSLATRTIFMVL